MALYGDLTHDSRVIREADTLASEGWAVRVYWLAGSPPAGSGFESVAVMPGGSVVLPDGSSPFLRASNGSRLADFAHGLPGRSDTPGPFALGAGHRPGRGRRGRVARPRPDRPDCRRLAGPAAGPPGVRQPRGVPVERVRDAAPGNRPSRAPEVRAALGPEGGGTRHGERQHRIRPRSAPAACRGRRGPELPASLDAGGRRSGPPADGPPPRARRPDRAVPRRVHSRPRDRAARRGAARARRRARPWRAPRFRPDARGARGHGCRGAVRRPFARVGRGTPG